MKPADTPTHWNVLTLAVWTMLAIATYQNYTMSATSYAAEVARWDTTVFILRYVVMVHLLRLLTRKAPAIAMRCTSSEQGAQRWLVLASAILCVSLMASLAAFLVDMHVPAMWSIPATLGLAIVLAVAYHTPARLAYPVACVAILGSCLVAPCMSKPSNSTDLIITDRSAIVSCPKCGYPRYREDIVAIHPVTRERTVLVDKWGPCITCVEPAVITRDEPLPDRYESDDIISYTGWAM
jgi:hypothetical protein